MFPVLDVKQLDPMAEKRGRQGRFARAKVNMFASSSSDETAAEEVHLRAIRGRLLSFSRAPNGAGDSQSYRYIEDGIILLKDGRVEAVGPADSLSARLPAGTPVDRH